MVSNLWDRSGDVGPGGLHQSLWLSPDGSHWEELGMPPRQSAGLVVEKLITATDGSYVAYGSQSTRDAGYRVVGLRSTDGANWQEVETGLSPEVSVQAIEPGPAGFLLVGGQTGETHPTLWLSIDGLAWELVHEFRQTTHWIQIHDADGGEEGYVVIGRRIEPDGDYQRFAFASADGRTWTNRNAPFGPDNQDYVFEANVSSLGPDWVATLGHHDAPTAVWFSANGLDWSSHGSLQAPGNTSAGVFDELDDGLLYSPGFGYYEGTPGVWSSTDGATWTPEEFGSEIWLGDVATGVGVTAVTGTIPGANDSSAAGVWIKPAP